MAAVATPRPSPPSPRQPDAACQPTFLMGRLGVSAPADRARPAHRPRTRRPDPRAGRPVTPTRHTPTVNPRNHKNDLQNAAPERPGLGACSGRSCPGVIEESSLLHRAAARRPPVMTGQPPTTLRGGYRVPNDRAASALKCSAGATACHRVIGEAEGWHRPAPEVAQSSTEEYTRGFGYFTEERA